MGAACMRALSCVSRDNVPEPAFSLLDGRLPPPPPPNASQLSELPPKTQRNLRVFFELFDLTGSGSLSRQELEAGLRLLGNPEAEQESTRLVRLCRGTSQQGTVGFPAFVACILSGQDSALSRALHGQAGEPAVETTPPPVRSDDVQTTAARLQAGFDVRKYHRRGHGKSSRRRLRLSDDGRELLFRTNSAASGIPLDRIDRVVGGYQQCKHLPWSGTSAPTVAWRHRFAILVGDAPAKAYVFEADSFEARIHIVGLLQRLLLNAG